MYKVISWFIRDWFEILDEAGMRYGPTDGAVLSLGWSLFNVHHHLVSTRTRVVHRIFLSISNWKGFWGSIEWSFIERRRFCGHLNGKQQFKVPLVTSLFLVGYFLFPISDGIWSTIALKNVQTNVKCIVKLFNGWWAVLYILC